MSVPVCYSVRLLCREEPTVLPFYTVVKVGENLGGCKLAFVTPSPCLLSPNTNITYEDYVEIETVPFKKNIKVYLRFSSGVREVYIYPQKVWDEVYDRLIEPLRRGDMPREQGIILYGPPGTGKTSMAEIIALNAGLYTVPVGTEIMSKYLGESEANLRKRLREAEANEPSMVLLDDAEWLTRGRSYSGEDSATYMALMNILLGKTQEWSRSKRRVVMVVTTNMGAEVIDVALRRSGRLGRPVFVPLPDYVAVSELLKEYGVEARLADELAVKIVNAGLPMSDVVSIAKQVLAGKEPKIEPIEGQGYTRFVPPTVSQRVMNYLTRSWGMLCAGMRKGARVWLPYPASLGIPLAVSAVGLVCKKPIILMNDIRRMDDALETAKQSEAILIINSELVPPDYIKLAVSKAPTVPIIFVGSERPGVTAVTIRKGFVNVESKKAVTELVLRFYEIEVDDMDKEMQFVLNMRDKDWEKLVESLALFRAPPREAASVLGIH